MKRPLADCECPECGEETDVEGEPCETCREEFEHEKRCDREDREDFDIDFADPGGKSALRAATPDNPRDLPCPNCGTENVLTRADKALGYQCDRCADAAEMGIDR